MIDGAKSQHDEDPCHSRHTTPSAFIALGTNKWCTTLVPSPQTAVINRICLILQ